MTTYWLDREGDVLYRKLTPRSHFEVLARDGWHPTYPSEHMREIDEAHAATMLEPGLFLDGPTLDPVPKPR